MTQTQSTKTTTATAIYSLTIAPGCVLRGQNALAQATEAIARFGNRPLIVGGSNSLAAAKPYLQPILESAGAGTATPRLQSAETAYGKDCSETSLQNLREAFQHHNADFIIGVGGGKALDAAKLLAHQCQIPIVTIPTSAATCAAWTALSNIYSEQGVFQYDVALARCPDLLILDYGLIQTAPQRTLIAGIGDAIAKWYEASVSSGHSEQTMIISAVQQARILRDILFQKSATALKEPGSETWQQVTDAAVLLAGVIGGIGGPQCRTVAAHAVHNGLTHLLASHGTLHGEKVAYGILVQLRLEEMLQNNQLAATARQQLLKFYGEIGLPQTLDNLGLGDVSLTQLQRAADIACQPNSDIHRLPFKVVPEQLMAAMVSTTAPVGESRVKN
ncbi:iron-containing alcohol dehydrogenase family protein [Microcoleus sp. LEGE 07076]|uniref:iron-containing alcohol dehydrogenase family protein n=1 Tax=Microcoleus sp. LEGE 07076 TaxID=915322 RepID=UPI00187F1188|nr:iron-containing alcohol dehydrogenase family protein [Microcoleus sp. LEGE 07076]MBE9187837.1 iron-containing alcohol dehydrogenase family protein [Microcoleus sp. LEGE 07076]